MKRFHLGGIVLGTLVFATTARAGLLVRQDEARPYEVIEELKQPRGFVPADVKQTWGRFLDTIAQSRNMIARPALLDPRNPRAVKPGDLGDAFLDGFQMERGLHKKLRVLAGYRIGISRAGRWLQGLEGSHRQALRASFQALVEEADAAEGILIHQIGVDLAHGGKALAAATDHVQRAGFTEEAAQVAFGGLATGLKGRLVALANAGEIDEETRRLHARQLEHLERLIRGS